MDSRTFGINFTHFNLIWQLSGCQLRIDKKHARRLKNCARTYLRTINKKVVFLWYANDAKCQHSRGRLAIAQVTAINFNNCSIVSNSAYHLIIRSRKDRSPIHSNMYVVKRHRIRRICHLFACLTAFSVLFLSNSCCSRAFNCSIETVLVFSSTWELFPRY